MHILSGGRLRMRRQIYLPSAQDGETIDLPVSAFLFRHPQGNVLFDTGCHPDVANDAQRRWGDLVQSVVPVMGPDENVISELGRINLMPEDIDIVVNSHLHCDHCGGNAFFSKATVYIHADELAHAGNADMERQGYFQTDWQQPMPIVEIDGERDIFGDGRLVLLPLPGHTPGLTGLLASLPESGTCLLTSDAVALKPNLEADAMPQNIWNRDMHSQSIAEIKRIKRSGATLIYGHDLEQWSTFRPAEECYA